MIVSLYTSSFWGLKRGIKAIIHSRHVHLACARLECNRKDRSFCHTSMVKIEYHEPQHMVCLPTTANHRIYTEFDKNVGDGGGASGTRLEGYAQKSMCKPKTAQWSEWDTTVTGNCCIWCSSEPSWSHSEYDAQNTVDRIQQVLNGRGLKEFDVQILDGKWSCLRQMTERNWC